ncbi:PhoX family phosphatase [Sphingomonas cannabina]|uniref:PhoX family protein n=1 Tax=Sphingomonas cannabina TaxID=2899123 RepID=UPI001F1D7A24|nr:PhoX family phosphatase [Sphingomonas cannabina]UIJ46774.1 PhoX family phosphatase [Sphingomonas cannabina]
MTEIIRTDIGYDDGDVDTNRSTGPSLNDLIDQRYSRRETLRSGVGAMAMAVFGSTALAACDNNDDDNGTGNPPPTVSATASPATATAGTLVTVTGTATDDGSVTATTFTQVSGPVVSLSATTGTSTTFVAPAVSSTTSVAIRFAATDNSGNTSSADAIVSVSAAKLSFTAVAKNKNDVVTVPAGYTVGVLYRTGDPITADTAAYKNDGTDTGFANRAGDHHDAMHWFGLASDGSRDDQSSTRGLLAMNHENINQAYLHVNGPTSPGGARPESEAIKEIEAHGVSVVEVTKSSAGWGYVQASSYNRRVTPNTPVVFNGPVKGSSLIQTAFSTDGSQGRGTLNNCANGYTQWGTLLTCEENWAGYFRRPAAADNPRRSAKEVTALTRYGVTSSSGNFGWATVAPADGSNTSYRRFDAQATGGSATTDFRNEPNQFGWVVEIDPYDKSKTPRKRTALGRMNHEGCWPSPFVAGVKPAFYMGDDAVNEYLYKFVSATAWVAADATNADRLAMGDKYLDSGTLYVAQFKADGTGTWLPLTFGTAPLTSANTTYPFADQADVLTHARLAGDALAATKMDRPEWTAVNPATGEVYLTLTNNSTRTPANADAANPRAYKDPPSTSIGNRNGHIIRLREASNSSEATTFTWDIYLFGAGQDLDPANINVSGLTSDNDFSSPDGCWFSRNSNVAGQATPLLWIQTDDSAYLDVTNCMMLAAIPGIVGDGGDAANKTIVNTNADGTTVSVATKVGKAPGTNLKRFLVGPLEAEITGVDTTPDGRTMFVNIQHPGENGNTTNITSHWPANQATGSDPSNSRPRSATIVIQRTDGGVIGL